MASDIVWTRVLLSTKWDFANESGLDMDEEKNIMEELVNTIPHQHLAQEE